MKPSSLMGRIVVIGSGPGGLATAIRLGAAGHRVLVFERAAEPCASLGRLELGDGFFDPEPGCVLLPAALGELFSVAGTRLKDMIDLLPLRPAWRFVFPDGTTFDLRTEKDALREEIAKVSPPDAKNLDAFLKTTRRAFKGLSRGPWMETARGRFGALGGFLRPPALLRLPWVLAPRTAAAAAAARWRDPRLARAFAHLATELGASPRHAPAAALWTVYAALQFGVWYPRGGMWGLRRALLRLADQAGVQLRCNEAVGEILIRDNAVVGIHTREGRTVEADAVVDATDPHALAEKLPPAALAGFEGFQRRWTAGEGSFARHALHWRCTRDWPLLAHQTVFFSDSEETEYQYLRDWAVPPPEPTLTVAHPARTDRDLERGGKTALTAWMLAPPLSERWRWSEENRAAMRERLVARLVARGLDGLDTAIEAERETPPATAREDYGRHRGMNRGTASHSLAGLVARYPNEHPRLAGLYSAGRSTHPGPTLPQTLLGGRNTARRIGSV